MHEMARPQTEVVFPDDFGFCEGVVAADDLLREVSTEALARGILHIYGYHDVVHNQDVVREHEQNGVIFVNGVDEIPPGSVVVTSAHGVGPEVVYALKAKDSLVFEAACPLVLYTHAGVEKARENNEKVIYICQGKPGEVEKLHDEVQGMVGHLDYVVRDGQLIHEPIDRTYVRLTEKPSEINDLLCDDQLYRIISQTTLNDEDYRACRQQLYDYIKSQQPEARVSWVAPGNVCKAVRLRQAGVKQLIQLKPDRLVVVTDLKSKNGRGYVELGKRLVAQDSLATEVVSVASVEEAEQLGPSEGLTAITASASTPDRTTLAVAKKLGLKEIPHIERKSFGLKDARRGVIEKKLAAFTARLAIETGF